MHAVGCQYCPLWKIFLYVQMNFPLLLIVNNTESKERQMLLADFNMLAGSSQVPFLVLDKILLTLFTISSEALLIIEC